MFPPATGLKLSVIVRLLLALASSSLDQPRFVDHSSCSSTSSTPSLSSSCCCIAPPTSCPALSTCLPIYVTYLPTTTYLFSAQAQIRTRDHEPCFLSRTSLLCSFPQPATRQRRTRQETLLLPSYPALAGWLCSKASQLPPYSSRPSSAEHPCNPPHTALQRNEGHSGLPNNARQHQQLQIPALLLRAQPLLHKLATVCSNLFHNRPTFFVDRPNASIPTCLFSPLSAPAPYLPRYGRSDRIVSNPPPAVPRRRQNTHTTQAASRTRVSAAALSLQSSRP
ncbi:hypothetical protein EV126DRAFT_110572 [Verticillium dahliae]|nr:hypothetical protein EV126DRAFT_110572 [Verticillium dahliae]